MFCWDMLWSKPLNQNLGVAAPIFSSTRLEKVENEKKNPLLGKTDDIGGQFSVEKNDFGYINFPLSSGK